MVVLPPNGIDTREFHVQVYGREVRQRHGIPDGAPVAGVIGWFRPWHGLDALIRACATHRLFEERNLYLLLVGDGPAVPEARRLAGQLGCADRVIITGAVPRAEIPAYGAAMDVAVQPRVTAYACPMKIIEYLGLGRSIVAPDQPNIRDLLTHNCNALLFRPEDYSALADAIERVVVDEGLRARLSRAAAATIEERDLTWTGNARRVVELAEGLGGRSGFSPMERKSRP
jgi:glycosyltransferase involved in cell wall biosynthesis